MDVLLLLRWGNVALGVASIVLVVLIVRRIPHLQGVLVAASKGLLWALLIFLVACVYLTVDALVRHVPTSPRSLGFFIPLVVMTQALWWLRRSVNTTWRAR